MLLGYAHNFWKLKTTPLMFQTCPLTASMLHSGTSGTWACYRPWEHPWDPHSSCAQEWPQSIISFLLCAASWAANANYMMLKENLLHCPGIPVALSSVPPFSCTLLISSTCTCCDHMVSLWHAAAATQACFHSHILSASRRVSPHPNPKLWSCCIGFD